jgi:CRISPR-associated protein Cmr3
MHPLLLSPTDVLFFRDGRPMSGSLSGHAAAWPLPHVISHALHAALHRADFEGVHAHRRGRRSDYQEQRDRKFGSLVTAGPFPVCTKGAAHTWFFPRPLDAGLEVQADTTFLPLAENFTPALSSLPKPLLYPVANTLPARKVKVERWFSEGAINSYLKTAPRDELAGRSFFKDDADFADSEYTVGIGMDDDSGAQDGQRFYSASYLRLREGWRLGMLAAAEDRDFKHPQHGNDLIRSLLNGYGTEIIAGGQQRVCTATLEAYPALPLPRGMSSGFQVAQTREDKKERYLVKWVLLTPALWPQVLPGLSKRGTQRQAHPGGSLPAWVDPANGQVLLQVVSEQERKRRRHLNYAGQGYATDANATAIPARLVAAMVGKPLTVTGYALPHEQADRASGGAKSTHLAVPAGSVYYFEAESAEAATALADALNWHGSATGKTIQNRRSTLMGEKGYGLGVCATWTFHKGDVPT